MKGVSVVKILFSLIGLVFLAASGFWANSTRSFVNTAWTSEGTVVDLLPVESDGSTLYTPLVRYVTNQGEEVEFTTGSASKPPAFSVGEKVEVFYQPANPRDAMINTFFQLWGGPLIFGGLGSVFFAVGFGMIVFAVTAKRREALLRRHGVRVDANFKGVELNKSVSVNGRHPYRIVAHWREPSTNKVYVFRSNNLWFEPSEYIDRETIPVFIDKGNAKRYLIDLSFLPEVVQ